MWRAFHRAGVSPGAVGALGAAATWTTAQLCLSSFPAAAADAAAPTAHQGEQQRPSSRPPDTLREGVHFAVLSGADGSSSKLRDVAAAMCKADVVLLGEFHDDAVAHALQLALLRNVAAQLGHNPCTQPPQQSQSDQPKHQQHGQQHGQQHSQVHSQQPQPHQPAPLRPLILSLEMFEQDVQPVLSEYLAGHIPLSDLLKDARPWSNYIHDYSMLVDTCKQLKLPVVAANAPRRYVSLAGREGSEALLKLPAAARQWLPPLPHRPPSEAYVRKVQRSMQQATAGMEALQQEQQMERQQQQQGPGSTTHPGAAKQQQWPPALQQDRAGAEGCPHIGLTLSSNFLAAQSLWDASMAHAISKALQQQHACGRPDSTTPQQQQPATARGSQAASQAAAGASPDSSLAGAVGRSPELPAGPLVVHVCGKFHCEHGLGIPEHLAEYAPGATVLVVVFTPADSMQQDAASLAGVVGSADFIVLTDSKLPRSFVVEHPV